MKKLAYGFVVLFLFALMGMPALYAEGEIVGEVFSEDDTGASDPSEFEGDSENMPGERAPENMPMDDAPVDAGMGVNI
ncbi:MAG: hypothetical protein HY767_03425 [Candidatus Omnitrophica bacterium]|nr:hypothetical protein [Candidatus Omnitrophota bacterium]